MIAKLMATVALAVAVSTIAQAYEPKHGGILHIYHRETPAHADAARSLDERLLFPFRNKAAVLAG